MERRSLWSNTGSRNPFYLILSLTQVRLGSCVRLDVVTLGLRRVTPLPFVRGRVYGSRARAFCRLAPTHCFKRSITDVRATVMVAHIRVSEPVQVEDQF